MKPGRELDALIAEKVMGWTDVHLHDGTAKDTKLTTLFYGEWVGRPRGEGALRRVLPYSTDIAAAWEVVEKMRASYSFQLQVPRLPLAGDVFDWSAVFFVRRTPEEWGAFHSASTAPHAICLAALRAVGVDVTNPSR